MAQPLGNREDVDAVAAGMKLGVAAILYTYQCTIACRHCCFASGRNRPPIRMTTPQAPAHLRSLHRLGRVIHIAGGECMIFWDDLQKLLACAQSEGVQPHFIETNCGVVLANTNETDLVELMRRGPDKANWLVELLVHDGPFGLADFAAAHHGFAVPATARTKCDLCYTVRSALRPFYPKILAPAEVYER